MDEKDYDFKHLVIIADYLMETIINDLLNPEKETGLIELIGQMVTDDTVLPLYESIRKEHSALLIRYEDAAKAIFAQVFSSRLLKAVNKQDAPNGRTNPAAAGLEPAEPHRPRKRDAETVGCTQTFALATRRSAHPL